MNSFLSFIRRKPPLDFGSQLLADSKKPTFDQPKVPDTFFLPSYRELPPRILNVSTTYIYFLQSQSEPNCVVASFLGFDMYFANFYSCQLIRSQRTAVSPVAADGKVQQARQLKANVTATADESNLVF